MGTLKDWEVLAIVVRIRHSLKKFVATNGNPGILAASLVLHAKLSWLPLVSCLIVIIWNTVLCCVKLVKFRIDIGQYSEDVKVLLVECIALGLSVCQSEMHFVAVLELLAPPLLSAPPPPAGDATICWPHKCFTSTFSCSRFPSNHFASEINWCAFSLKFVAIVTDNTIMTKNTSCSLNKQNYKRGVENVLGVH